MVPFVPLLPLGIGVLAAGAYWAVGRRDKFHGEMTAERQIVFDTALQTLKDPVKLRTLSEAFDKVGLKEEANLLRQRANLRNLPKEVTVQRRDAFRRGMSSNDPVAILKLAKCFRDNGATGVANKLERRAKGLSAMGNATVTPPTTVATA